MLKLVRNVEYIFERVRGVAKLRYAKCAFETSHARGHVLAFIVRSMLVDKRNRHSRGAEYGVRTHLLRELVFTIIKLRLNMDLVGRTRNGRELHATLNVPNENVRLAKHLLERKLRHCVYTKILSIIYFMSLVQFTARQIPIRRVRLRRSRAKEPARTAQQVLRG